MTYIESQLTGLMQQVFTPPLNSAHIHTVHEKKQKKKTTKKLYDNFGKRHLNPAQKIGNKTADNYAALNAFIRHICEKKKREEKLEALLKLVSTSSGQEHNALKALLW